MKAQFVNENIRFERGADPKEAMNIGRRISLEMPTYLDPPYFKGEIPLEKADEDTQYFIRALDEAGVKWKYLGHWEIYIELKISGLKEDIIKVLPLWDAHGRDEYELAKDLEDWDGDQETIDNELF